MSHATEQRALDADTFELILSHIARMSNVELIDLQNQAFSKTSADTLRSDLTNYLLERYELYTHRADESDLMQDAQKWLMLETLDNAWKQHMLNLDHLKEGIGLRGWGQKNPLIEYKREAFYMFKDMMQSVRYDIVTHIFTLDLKRFDAHALEVKRMRELSELHMAGAVDTTDGETPTGTSKNDAESMVGRNDACPCGSGKKYKKCHGA